MILPNCGAIFTADKLLGDTWPHHLGEAVNIGRIYAATRFDRLSHSVGPGFGTKNSEAQFEFSRIDTLAV